jgi:hypothetical protein
LNEVAGFLEQLDSFHDSPQKLLDFLGEQRVRLERRIGELRSLVAYLDAKVGSIEGSHDHTLGTAPAGTQLYSKGETD